MATISGPDGIDLEGQLAAAGVRFVFAPGDDAPEAVIAEVLRMDERQIRAVVVAKPPEPGAEHTGMGAWHVNAETEAHFVRSGRGMVQFVLPQGECTVEITAGDVMIVSGAEHRYRPLEPQEWVIRHSGPAEAQLGARETGRESAPWPT